MNPLRLRDLTAEECALIQKLGGNIKISEVCVFQSYSQSEISPIYVDLSVGMSYRLVLRHLLRHFPGIKLMRQSGLEARTMTYEEMVPYLLETICPIATRGDELMAYITAEIEAAEARGAITPEVREKVYRYFGVTSIRDAAAPVDRGAGADHGAASAVSD